MSDNSRGVTRFTLVTTLLVSIIANITHSVLAASQITLWLRVPGAAVWPILTFLAIEIIVRTPWRKAWSHNLARTFVLGPAVPAMIVSYEHQQSLLKMMGESSVVSVIGPIAIDGLMIGCTLTLLFVRPASGRTEKMPTLLPIVPLAAPTVVEAAEEIAREAAAEAPATPARRPRAGAEGAMRAVELLKAGAATGQAAVGSGLSMPAVRRYAAVVRELREDPHASIDTRKRSVRPEVVDSIRAWARLESAR